MMFVTMPAGGSEQAAMTSQLSLSGLFLALRSGEQSCQCVGVRVVTLRVCHGDSFSWWTCRPTIQQVRPAGMNACQRLCDSTACHRWQRHTQDQQEGISPFWRDRPARVTSSLSKPPSHEGNGTRQEEQHLARALAGSTWQEEQQRRLTVAWGALCSNICCGWGAPPRHDVMTAGLG